MKKRTVITPIVIGAALILTMVVIAVTDVFKPLIQFIHTGEIAPLQALWCLIATALAFGLAAKLLIMLGEYFLFKAEERRARRDGN